jgi:hypothetical protein
VSDAKVGSCFRFLEAYPHKNQSRDGTRNIYEVSFAESQSETSPRTADINIEVHLDRFRYRVDNGLILCNHMFRSVCVFSSNISSMIMYDKFGEDPEIFRTEKISRAPTRPRLATVQFFSPG